MKCNSRFRPIRHAVVVCTAALCALVMIQTSAMGVVIDASANQGLAAPDGGAGTGLSGQFFDSGGGVGSIKTLLGSSTAPDKVWDASTVDYPQGGQHNTASDGAGLITYLGTDAPSVIIGTVITNINNSRFAMRGYIEITAAMDLTPGGNINTKFRLSSDDDGQIVFNGGLDADGTTGAPGVNINRNTTTDVDFQSAGFYQIDVIYQESGGNTGVTLQAQLAGINGGALSVIPMSLFAPNVVDTPAASDVPGPLSVPLQSIKVPDGFKVDLVYTVPLEEQGSWVALTPDDSGRLITSDQFGGLYRVTVGEGTSETTAERIDVPIGQVQGLLYAYDSLYAVVNNLNKTAGEDIAQENGLYRLQDSDGDDQFDKVTLIRRLESTGTENAHGEHGPHTLQLGPDGQIYFLTGNGIKVPQDVEPTSPYRDWADDFLVPSGDLYVPGGWVARTNRTGTRWELLCGGLRNPYDIAFNLEGELFTADADSEGDIGTYWYRPTRVNHILSAAEYGWRYDTGPWLRHGKWPDYYPDSVGSVVDIGHGSPAGVTFGTGARFPAKYQRAMFVCDWAKAQIYAIHMQHEGASYSATGEPFLAGEAMPLTDIVVNHDGAMYFTIGGRRTQSGIFRIRYVGDEPTDPVEPLNNLLASKARDLRRRLERFHGRSDPRAVEEAWPHLDSVDRTLRYAARIAIEHQELPVWQDRALTEDRLTASIQVMLALARVGGPELQEKVLERLNRLPLDEFSDAQLLDVLRVYSLAFIRMGGKRPEVSGPAISRLEPLFPSSNETLNRALCQLLVYLGSPGVIDEALNLLGTSQNAEDRSFYIAELSQLTGGWNFQQRRAYFSLTGPHALARFRGNEPAMRLINSSRATAVAQLSNEDKEALLEAIEGPPDLSTKQQLDSDFEVSRAVVQQWQLADLIPSLRQVESGRSYPTGKSAYEAAQCAKCHRVGGQGGTTGPDLTTVGSRFDTQYLLEALLVPSKVISDRYRNEIIETEDGLVITGRVVYDDGQHLRIRTDPFTHNSTEVAVDNIEIRTHSEISEMPEGLLNILTEEEILDLIAYLSAGGDPDHRFFVTPEAERE